MADPMKMNNVVTYETCPECQEPNVKVEHGHDESGPCHLWHCPNPECSNQEIAIVGYDCPHCNPVQE